ncbi:MAG TPA: C10 family peptidase [Bacteroidales bacterium]|nr:C10 family peptidase [Bacteroidales bacterium]HSA44107.1 C10 family peptidase [Bacteroidales bacterium]
MIKHFPFTLLIVLFSSGLFAGEVSDKMATKAGMNFMAEKAQQYNFRDFSTDQCSLQSIRKSGVLLYHIINFSGGGFIIISGQDVVRPVIAYSPDGRFDLQTSSPSTVYLMDGYGQEILFHHQNGSQADHEIAAAWQSLLSDDFQADNKNNTKDVSPLLLSKWDQGKYYNDLCPADAGGDGGHTYVGCVATAMAQVMYYYRYPLQGTGSFSYYHPQYGQLSANFGNTLYPWDGMLNSLIRSNQPVALLSYHCGVSVSMDYGPDGSGANTGSVAAALKLYFRYASSTKHVQRMSYSAQGWIDLFRNNLDQKRPCIYSGRPTGGGAGHAWVVDGYQGTDYFHMNWGWSGASDGYFTLNNLNPSAGGSNFNSDHGAIVDIYPGNNFPYHCDGPKIISEHTSGTIEDGSGPDPYNDLADCSWLLAPDDSVKSIRITFNRFNTQSGADVVKIYGGNSTAAPLLGSFSGTSLPASIEHQGSRLLITFQTDSSSTAEGWLLTYSATFPEFCSNTSLTALSGTITDGSGPKNYSPGTICTWIIQPPNAAAITLTFTEFDTEPVNDYIKIYDLNTQALLGSFSGNTLPPPVMTTTGGMYIEFKTNGSVNKPGWTAQYQALGAGIDMLSGFDELHVYPNPAEDRLTISLLSSIPQQFSMIISDLSGRTLLTESHDIPQGSNTVSCSVDHIPAGIYLLKLAGEQGSLIQKLIIH